MVVCDEYLPACEIKSHRTNPKSNYCVSCKINRKHILGLFGLNYVTLSKILSNVSDPVSYGKQVFNLNQIIKKHFDMIIEDSVTRYFYGVESTFNNKLVNEIRGVMIFSVGLIGLGKIGAFYDVNSSNTMPLQASQRKLDNRGCLLKSSSGLGIRCL